jgi:hypothetical protein
MAAEIMSYSKRVIIAIALLVCFGLASSLQMLRSARWQLAGQPAGRDGMTVFETRLEGVRRDLPASGVVGYVSDLPDQINEELIWTRYYLVPLVVLASTQHQLVIGNFHNTPTAKFLSDRDLVPVKEYGEGMMLLSRGEH